MDHSQEKVPPSPGKAFIVKVIDGEKRRRSASIFLPDEDSDLNNKAEEINSESVSIILSSYSASESTDDDKVSCRSIPFLENTESIVTRHIIDFLQDDNMTTKSTLEQNYSKVADRQSTKASSYYSQYHESEEGENVIDELLNFFQIEKYDSIEKVNFTKTEKNSTMIEKSELEDMNKYEYWFRGQKGERKILINSDLENRKDDGWYKEEPFILKYPLSISYRTDLYDLDPDEIDDLFYCPYEGLNKVVKQIHAET